MRYSSLLCAWILAFAATALRADEPVRVELVSKNTCKEKDNWLADCKLKQTTVKRLSVSNSLIPFRSLVKVEVDGDCACQFPVRIEITSVGQAEKFEVSPLEEKEHHLKLKSKLPLANLEISQTKAWKQIAVFDKSCKSTLAIFPDEPDFASKEEVTKHLPIVKKQFNDLQRSKKLVSELIAHRTSFSLIWSVARLLNERGRSPTLEEIKTKAETGLSALKKLRENGNSLSDVETETIAKIEDWLESLADSKKLPSPREFSDYFSEEERATLTRLAGLSRNEDSLPEELRKVNTELTKFCQELEALPKLLQHLLTEKEVSDFVESINECKSNNR